MIPFLAMVKANMKMVLRNRQALFWNLAFPAIFILIFGAVFSDGGQVQFNVGIAGEASPYREAVTRALESDEETFVVSTGETDAELAELDDSEREFVLVFAAPEPAQGQFAAPVEIAFDETEGPNADIGVNVLRQVLLGVAGAEDAVPITTRGVQSLDISFIDFFVPGILAMSLMNSGVIGLATSFVTYRERGILRRIKVTPFSLTSFILARIVTQLIVAVLQAVVLVALGRLIYGLTLRGNILVILLGITVGALCFLAIGFAISGIARNTETAASYGNLITFPMLFLSGVFFDIDAMPGWLRPIVNVLPLKYLVDALRDPMTRGRGLEAIWLDLVVLLAIFAVAMAIAVRFFRWDARAA